MNQSFAIAMLLATLGAGALHAEDVPDISPKAVDAINALQELGSFDEAAQAAQMLVAARGRALGPEAPETLRARILLAQVVSEQLWVTGETETQLRELLPVATKVFGVQQRETLVCLSTLAFVLASQGDNAAAEELCRGLIPIETKVLGAEDPETLKARRMHAKILHRLGKHEEAGRAESELLDFCQHAFGAEGKEMLRIRVAMAATQGELHRPAAAEGELRALLPVLARVFGAEHYETQKAIDALTIVLRHQEKYAQAQQERQKWVDIATRILGPDGSHTLGLRLQQAEDLHAQGRDAEATQERQAVLAALDRTRGTEDRVTLRTCHLLALSLKQQNKTAEALPFAQRALEGRLKLLGSKAHDTDASQRLVNQLTYASPQDLKPKADAAGPDAKKRPVAMVDGALIFASDIRQLVEAQAEVLRYHHQSEPDRLARELAKLDRSALGILIDKHLLINEFNRTGRVVKAAFIDTDLDNLIKDGYKGSREAFLQELGQRGLTLEEFRTIREHLLMTNTMRSLFAGEVGVTDAEVRDYYDKNKRRWSAPEQVKIRTLTLSPNKTDARKLAEKLRGEVAAGADFAETARTHSGDSHAEDGGAWDWTSLPDFSECVREAAAKTPKGGLSGVIEQGGSFIFLRVDDRRVPAAPPFEEVKDKAAEALRVEKRQERIDNALNELRAKADIQMMEAL